MSWRNVASGGGGVAHVGKCGISVSENEKMALMAA